MGMEYTHLGRTGLSVSRLCLGTMNFGPDTSEQDAGVIMDRAHAEGINFFDTANVYGRSVSWGATEEILGRWFAQGGGRRERTVLATKLYGPMDVDGAWPNNGKLSAFNIRQAVDASLRRMQTDHIDLYQMHHVDRATPWEEIWQAMEQLIREGKITYVGSSNFAGWDIATAQSAATSRGPSAWSPSRASTTSPPAPSSWRSCPRAGITDWVSCPGARSAGACSAASSRKHRREGGPVRGCNGRSSSYGPSSRRGRTCAASSVNSRPTSPWPGCSTSPLSRPRSRVPGPPSS